MPKQKRLLSLTHLLLRIATGLSGFVAIVLLLGLGGIVAATANFDSNYLHVPAEIDGVVRDVALEIGGGAVAGGLVCVTLVLFVFRATMEIVGSAMSGDPFVDENARRLARIGWLLIAANVAGFLTKLALDGVIPAALKGQVNFGFNASPLELLIVLLAFVLAQIFRHGSEMRADLDGTV